MTTHTDNDGHGTQTLLHGNDIAAILIAVLSNLIFAFPLFWCAMQLDGEYADWVEALRLVYYSGGEHYRSLIPQLEELYNMSAMSITVNHSDPLARCRSGAWPPALGTEQRGCLPDLPHRPPIRHAAVAEVEW